MHSVCSPAFRQIANGVPTALAGKVFPTEPQHSLAKASLHAAPPSSHACRHPRSLPPGVACLWRVLLVADDLRRRSASQSEQRPTRHTRGFNIEKDPPAHQPSPLHVTIVVEERREEEECGLVASTNFAPSALDLQLATGIQNSSR